MDLVTCVALGLTGQRRLSQLRLYLLGTVSDLRVK